MKRYVDCAFGKIASTYWLVIYNIPSGETSDTARKESFSSLKFEDFQRIERRDFHHLRHWSAPPKLIYKLRKVAARSTVETLMKMDALKRLWEQEKMNARFKRAVNDLTLDKAILKEIAEVVGQGKACWLPHSLPRSAPQWLGGQP